MELIQSEISSAFARLDEFGFAVIPGPVLAGNLNRLSAAYDRAVAEAALEDVKAGRATTRVRDFVNRGPEFDSLYVYPPLLEASRRTLRVPFRLSTMHARTLRAGGGAQDLHVDFAPDEKGWTLVGFILMVDEFRPDNGATQFVPGSHLRLQDKGDDAVLACGPAGSLIIFNGSVWHGHTANESGQDRRSIQGAYIRRDAATAEDWAGRMTFETLERIDALGKEVLAI